MEGCFSNKYLGSYQIKGTKIRKQREGTFPSTICIHVKKQKRERDVQHRSCGNPNLTDEYTTNGCPGLHLSRSKLGNNYLMRITTTIPSLDNKEG